MKDYRLLQNQEFKKPQPSDLIKNINFVVLSFSIMTIYRPYTPTKMSEQLTVFLKK